jgi:hypothetical protein
MPPSELEAPLLEDFPPLLTKMPLWEGVPKDRMPPRPVDDDPVPPFHMHAPEVAPVRDTAKREVTFAKKT